jgi:hypothetical protein
MFGILWLGSTSLPQVGPEPGDEGLGTRAQPNGGVSPYSCYAKTTKADLIMMYECMKIGSLILRLHLLVLSAV